MRNLIHTACVLFVVMPLTACSFSNWHRSEMTMNQTSDHIAGSAVEVRSRNGRIEVVAVPNRTDIAITAKIYARGNTMAEASERLAASTLLISRTDDGALLESRNSPSLSGAVTVRTSSSSCPTPTAPPCEPPTARCTRMG